MPEKEGKNSEFVHIDHAISPQAHTPMYLMHKYWARKPHNVVGEYIERYSKKGEVVLDPFVGSGVTAIEALKRGRKAIAIDIDPLSTFITRMTLKPINLKEFKDAFKQLEKSVRKDIEKLYVTTCPNCGQPCLEAYVVWSDIVECEVCHEKVAIARAVKREKSLVCSSGHELNQNSVIGEEPIEIGCECKSCLEKSEKRVRFISKKISGSDTQDKERLMQIARQPIPYGYPKNVKLFYEEGKPFKKKESSNYLEDLFDKRSLIAHSTAYHEIERITNEDIRDMMKFVFSSNLHNVSKLNVVHYLRLRMGVHPSRGWVMHSYWIPHVRIELPFWFYFNERFQHILRGKKESNRLISHYKEAKSFEDLKKDANILICTQSALRLDDAPARILSESVQYVFTDPPYGGSIQYMELSTIYASWLKGERNDPRFDLKYDKEITINENQQKGFDYYHKMLKASFEQVYDVLKSGRWLTVTFHNTDIRIYNSIIKAARARAFAAYFISPMGQSLPFWPMLDTIIAVCLVYPAAKLSKNLFSENVKLLPISLVIISFITVAADGLTRVFLFIPAGLYSSVLGLSPAATTLAFVAGGVDSFIEDALVVVITLVVGVPILLALRKVLGLKKPLS